MTISFDELADHFDEHRGLPLSALRQFVGYVDDVLPGGGHHFIEPGIGTGRIALPLAMEGHHVTGLDISRPMLDACAAKARALRVNDALTLIEADARDMPVEDASFDGAVVAQLLYLVPDWTAVLDEIARVVKPGGIVIHLLERTQESDALQRWDVAWRRMIESSGYQHPPITPTNDEVFSEMQRRWPDTHEDVLAAWTFGQTVAQARDTLSRTLRPLYATVDDRTWNTTVSNFLYWAAGAFPDPDAQLDGTVVFDAIVSRV